MRNETNISKLITIHPFLCHIVRKHCNCIFLYPSITNIFTRKQVTKITLHTKICLELTAKNQKKRQYFTNPSTFLLLWFPSSSFLLWIIEFVKSPLLLCLIQLRIIKVIDFGGLLYLSSLLPRY